MMKSIKELFIAMVLFCLFQIYAFGQPLQITYGCSYDISQDKIAQIKDNNIRNNVLKKMESAKNIEYQMLICGDKASLKYIDKLTLRKEKVMAAIISSDMIYDRNNQVVFSLRNFMGNDVRVKDSLYKNRWEISKDTLKINGYIC